MGEKNSLKIVINGTKPSEIPMKKLAGYLADLAILYGEEKEVRFESINEGCIEIHSYATNVDSHNIIIANIIENTENSKFAKSISRDNYSAEIYSNNELISKVAPVSEDKPIIISKKNTKVQGELFHIAGKSNDFASVRLKGNDGEILLCTATKPDAIRLAGLLFKKIRVQGESQYEKKDGVWKLKNLKIEKFIELDDVRLSDGLGRLSADPANKWDEIENPEELILTYRSLS